MFVAVGKPLFRANHYSICDSAFGSQSKTTAKYANANRVEQNGHKHKKRAADKSHWHWHDVWHWHDRDVA